MASGSVSVRLPEEVLEALDKLAEERQQKVSDVVRELILSGLKNQGNTGNPAHEALVIDYLESITDVFTALLHETVGARYYALLATSYATDVESLLRERKVMNPDAKDALMGQFDEEALRIAHETWQQVLALKQGKGRQEGAREEFKAKKQ